MVYCCFTCSAGEIQVIFSCSKNNDANLLKAFMEQLIKGLYVTLMCCAERFDE